MSDDELRSRAERRFQEALEATGARDPREFLRNRLRELRHASPEAYRDSVAYYEGTLLPAVAADGSDPLAEWLEFARRMAATAEPGRAVQIAPDGRARAYERPVPPDALVLHLPDAQPSAAAVLGLPPVLSGPQRAAYLLLVEQRRE
jgi:hypothetical protein